jgi:hypothetical protein
MQKEKKVFVDIQKRHSTIIGLNGEVLFEKEGRETEVKKEQRDFLAQRKNV